MNKILAWNIGKWKKRCLHVLAMGRTLLLLMIISALFFVALGLGGMAEKRLNSSPVSSMKGFAGSVSSRFFVDMLGMEMPHLTQKEQNSAISGENLTSFVFQLLTNVNPQDPKSLIAREMPGMGANQPVLLRPGSGNTKAEAPEDYQPGPGLTETASSGEGKPGSDLHLPPGQDNTPSSGGDNTDSGEDNGDPPSKGSGQDKGNAAIAKKSVLIYHSHPREGYNPLLGTNSDNPSSGKPTGNVFQVGTYLSDSLQKLGIGVEHAQEDYQTKVKDYNWNFSYKYSRQTVKAALAQNDDLTYLIDIHRDSQRHKKTTTMIGDQSYAKVYFIIGHENPNWRKNEAFAAKIHKKLEAKYPGVSRGVWGKNGGGGNNGEYNQTLSPNSILIEIGGIDNTAAELKRTSKVLADMIAEVYWEEQNVDKASAKPASKNG
ncbi:stage II sporulation protein P [Paenibacillus silvae]|uniref:stage II sporulation protein P n=1 Tax=Paenibacillus silvae TaxID=1325358 RepID=UPI002006AE30|nr:stage II sporulation protein P [Paenibacillus silvae]MCK6075409.1 stage II sporulation protein P [Paenibacillus silvae]MCK6149796.1 stage II sporulation protein P [Paenibacillus silvae]MCK6268094.1 stage II sporulation protein P [Paenibacillus silvae]